jgi:hypothetical protein
MRVALVLVLLLPALLIGEGDIHCPLYPAARRAEDQRRTARELQFQRYSAAARRAAPRATAAAGVNFIDDYVFGKIAADGVPLADATTDPEFVRRIYLDLTGHIPTPDQVTNFQNDPDPDKRTALIDSLIGSPAYVDRWTQWYGDQFRVGSNYYNLISVSSRNLFYQYVRDMVSATVPTTSSRRRSFPPPAIPSPTRR